MQKPKITIEEALQQRAGLSPREYAQLMGLSEISVYRYMGTGELDSVKIGQRRIIPRSVYAPMIEGVQA